MEIRRSTHFNGQSTTAYIHNTLLPENVFGHTKKVRLFRHSIEQCRQDTGRQSLRILDVGCGSGFAVTRFLGNSSDDILGIDMYPPNIAYAMDHFERQGLHFACIDVTAFSDESYAIDVLIMADILEHLDDPAAMLTKAVELLAPNGRLLVTVPNGKGPFELESALSWVPFLGPVLMKLTSLFVAFLNKFMLKGIWSNALAIFPDDLPYNGDSGHIQFFTKRAMMRLFSNVGLEVTSSRNLSFLSGPFTNSVFTPWRAFCEWNTRVADHLPSWLASAWFFECRKREGGS